MKKRVLTRPLNTVFILGLIFLFALPVSADFMLGEAPEDDVEVKESSTHAKITGSVVLENSEESTWGYLSFIGLLFIVLLAAVIFLFQRVKPR